MRQQTFGTHASQDTRGLIGDYPRVYRPSGHWRIVLLGISLVVGAFAAAGIWYFGAAHETHGRANAVVMLGICLAVLFVSAYLAALMLVARVTLWPDRLESSGVIATRMLFRADIVCWKLLGSALGPPRLVLVARFPLKQLEVARIYKFDTKFWRWIESLPDMDQEDIPSEGEEAPDGEKLGSTSDTRVPKLAKRLSDSLAVVTGIACVWAWLDPRPSRVIIPILISLPWVAILVMARSRGLFRIYSGRDDSHPSVAIPFLAPGLLLSVRAATDINLLRWQEALGVSLGLGLLLWVSAIWADPSLKTRRATLVILCMFGMSYGFGAGIEVNALADRSPISVYQSTIADKSVSRERRIDYKLHLSPWGPKPEPDEVSVSKRFYDSVEPGNKACVSLHAGALRVAWYTVHPCLK